MRYLVLFCNSFFGTYPSHRGFDSVPEVAFTTDRAHLRDADAVVFHLPGDREIRDAVKYPGQLWIGWSLESKTRTRVRGDTKAMAAFDLFMGFDRNSDVWHPYVPPLDEWQRALAVPWTEPTEPVPAALFQSARTDQWGRDAYLTELMEHLRFDSYGRFLNNRSLPGDQGIATKLDVIRSYKFTLGFENTIEPDYVTEKFFEPLLIGSIPVYRGAPNVADYAPGDDCYIDAAQFSPKQLAARLVEIAADENEYRRLLAWRDNP